MNDVSLKRAYGDVVISVKDKWSGAGRRNGYQGAMIYTALWQMSKKARDRAGEAITDIDIE